jgi:(p)ppGpp synthase/HD superfamily hydrolase
MKKLALAIAITAKAFKDVLDKGGHPYILHCIRVMNNLHTDDEELKSVAILHDYVEDIFKNDPQRGLQSLREAGFSERVIVALDLLTHRDTTTYVDYIKILSHNEDARKVKLADLKDNSDITRLKGLCKKDFERLEKYHAAYIYLS